MNIISIRTVDGDCLCNCRGSSLWEGTVTYRKISVCPDTHTMQEGDKDGSPLLKEHTKLCTHKVASKSWRLCVSLSVFCFIVSLMLFSITLLVMLLSEPMFVFFVIARDELFTVSRSTVCLYCIQSHLCSFWSKIVMYILKSSTLRW